MNLPIGKKITNGKDGTTGTAQDTVRVNGQEVVTYVTERGNVLTVEQKDVRTNGKKH